MLPKKIILTFIMSLTFWSLGFFAIWHLYEFKLAFIISMLAAGFYFRLVNYFQFRDWEKEQGNTDVYVMPTVEATPSYRQSPDAAIAMAEAAERAAYEAASRSKSEPLTSL